MQIITNVVSDSTLQNLVGVEVSISNIKVSATVTSLQEVAPVYKINDLSTYNNFLIIPDEKVSQVFINGIY